MTSCNFLWMKTCTIICLWRSNVSDATSPSVSAPQSSFSLQYCTYVTSYYNPLQTNGWKCKLNHRQLLEMCIRRRSYCIFSTVCTFRVQQCPKLNSSSLCLGVFCRGWGQEPNAACVFCAGECLNSVVSYFEVPLCRSTFCYFIISLLYIHLCISHHWY